VFRAREILLDDLINCLDGVVAQAVLAGSKSLDEAYNEVQIATGKINNDVIRLRKLCD
jgi:hypothetical protein